MAYTTLRPEIDPHILCKDPSVKPLGGLDRANWDLTSRCYKALQNFSLNPKAKNYLKGHLFSSHRLEIVRITKPKIFIYRFGNGEICVFITTENGFLVEHPDSSLWDKAFPFIKH